MNNALAVSGIQRIGNLDGQRQQAIHLKWLPADLALQRFALQELHRDEMAALGLADLIDGADIGVIERGCGARLALETLQCSRVVLHLRRQEFEGYVPSEIQVFRLVHHAHTPAAQLRQDTVMRNRLAYHEVLWGLAG